MSRLAMTLMAAAFIGSLGAGWAKASESPQGLRHPQGAALQGAAGIEGMLPVSLDLTAIRGITVQHNGRWPPIDTLARDIVDSVTGDASYLQRDAVLWLLAWTFDPLTWQQQPLLPIKNAELRRELHLSATQTVFSYAELLGHERLRSLIDALAHVEEGRKLNPLESKVSGISNKLMTLQRVFHGQTIKAIPHPAEAGGVWTTLAASKGEQSDEIKNAQASWAALQTAFLSDDASAFASASNDLVAAVNAFPAGYRPSPQRIATELHYNALRPYRTAWMMMVGGAVLAALAMVVRRGWFDAIAILGLVAGFGMLTYGLWLRWSIAGRIPAANMFESLLFLSWGMGAFAIVAMIVLRQRIVPLTASAMGALALALADCLPVDYFIRPIPPVLNDTIWMSIHVPVIMVSYSVLALGVLFAHMQLFTMAFAPGRRQASQLIDTLHYWYIHVGAILLLIGIITGSMWAASSWGRYWGWDPKEVWSLVAFLGYLTILHVRIDRGRVPGWAYVVGAALTIALFVIVVPKLAPLSATSVLAL
ncbi:MAG: cytochrome c biogenesis protein, partial [Planctomycetota bacterium]